MQKTNSLLNTFTYVFLICIVSVLNLYAQDIEIERIKWRGKETEINKGIVVVTLCEQSKNLNLSQL